VDIDTIYERITYFLDRVLPVAEEYNVRLANHIADPPAPGGLPWHHALEQPGDLRRHPALRRAVRQPVARVQSLRRLDAEGLRDPATEIFPILEYLGSRNQIVNVHLRNIKGGWGYFEEVYPDNGDMNFVEVMRTLRDVGYDGMVMPDHRASRRPVASRRP
jgi:mannonate dehydratase